MPAPPAAKAELLVDVDTGRVLVAQNAHTPLPPGSLTKVLTAMIAADWLKANAVLPVTPVAANAAPDRLGMKAGQSWPLGIALHALLISSSNDAAYAIAERVSGTLGRFELTMRSAAAQLGLRDNPVLHDPAGLDGTEGLGGGNLISAWDLAVAARDMMANPKLAAIAGLKSYEFTGPDHIVYIILSHNRAFLNSYPGAIGVKTGFTDRAGVCVIEEAQRAGRHMMAVVLNGASPDLTAAMLLDRGFATAVRSERKTDAQLPPVSEPEPPLPATPRHVLQQGQSSAAPAEPAPRPAPTASLASSYGLDAAGGGVAVIALFIVVRGVRRRRERPIGSHAPR